MTSKPHFSILAQSFAGGPRPRTAALLLTGLWLLLYFAALFAPPVLDDADATHASAARAMATTGDLVTLRVDGVRYLEKAPLPYWLVAGCYRVFGFNTFATHLPQAVAVLLLMLLGHRWANQAFGARTGFYTAVSILTSAGVFLFTRIFIPEALLSLLLGSALFALLKCLGPIAAESATTSSSVATPEAAERPALAWYAGPLFYPAVMWGALACAILTKGLIALVFFVLTAALFLLLTGELNRIGRLYPLSGTALMLAIAAPWHILAGLRNPGPAGGHGFFWFYLVNEHFLRFLGERIPRDYNKMPGWVFWTQHLVWLFPWSLFLPLGAAALIRRYRHQVHILTAHAGTAPAIQRLEPRRFDWAGAILCGLMVAAAVFLDHHFAEHTEVLALFLLMLALLTLAFRRRRAGLPMSPFHRIDPQQRTLLLLGIFITVVLVTFSLSTNQEYYTFPIYLPLLLLIASTITRAEQTYSSSPEARRAMTIAHASLMAVGVLAALALFYGLWSSRSLPYTPDIGAVLAHRGVGDYTLSLSHLFDLTTSSFAALRLPALLAALSLLLGPAIAWMLRMQRRHIAATTAIALTSAGFLLAAQVAYTRFGNMLSSEAFAQKIRSMQSPANARIALYGDQANGSSIPFYLGRQVDLVEGRSTSMLFGSTFADAPHIFFTDAEYRSAWGQGERKILFVPPDARDHVAALLAGRTFLIMEQSGKQLLTDRPVEEPARLPDGPAR